ncbi:MAG TPA: hypothetical protein VF950_23555 [Planctomycetota bacterium]
MADEKKGGSGKELLVKHGEKIALGIAVLVLLAYVFLFYLPEKKNPDLNELRKNVDALAKEMRTPKPEDGPEPAKAWEQMAVGPWNTVLQPAKSADVWAASLRTEIAESTKKKPKVRPPQALAPSVAFENLEINLDSVVLTWSVKEFTPAEKSKLAKEKDPAKIPVDLTSFKIERDVNGAGKWDVLATLDDPKARTFKDVKIEPKTKYAYRITAISMKEPFLKNGGEDGAENASGVVAVLASPVAQTLGIWKITFANASRPANADRGMVYVTIEKFEKALGAKVERKQIHRDGDRIGWKEAQDGAEPSSKHKVQVGAKAFDVDFNTEVTLVSVKAKKVTVEITKCKPRFAAGGVKEYPCDKIKEKRTFDIHEIVTNGPDGRQTIQVPNPKDHPNGQDQICEECGGKKPVTRESIEQPDKPKEDPKVLEAKKKEADAEALFKEAEKLLKDGKKKEAAVRYEKLLKDFAATDFVAKGQRPLIEQKLAEARAN